MAHFFMLESQSDFCFALAIVQQERMSKCHFIISNTNAISGLELLFASTLKTEHNLNVFFHNPFSKSIKFKDGAKQIKRIVKKNRSKTSAFYFSDDTSALAQYMNRGLIKKDDHSCLIQNDLSLYYGMSTRHFSLIHRLKNKFKYGFFWQGINLGQLRGHAKMYVIKREFLSAVYKSNSVTEIQMTYLFSALWRNISVNLINQKFEDFFDLKRIHKIIILPKIESENELNAVSVEVLQKFAVDNNKKVTFIKNHAESLFNIKLKSNRTNMTLLPSEIPAESLLVFSKELEVQMYLPTSYLMILARLNQGRMAINTIFTNVGPAAENMEPSHPFLEFLRT